MKTAKSKVIKVQSRAKTNGNENRVKIEREKHFICVSKPEFVLENLETGYYDFATLLGKVVEKFKGTEGNQKRFLETEITNLKKEHSVKTVGKKLKLTRAK